MISKELKLAYKEIIDNDNYKFVRRLFKNLSTRFLAYLIINLINLLSRLSTKKNSLKNYLNALIETIKNN